MMQLRKFLFFVSSTFVHPFCVYKNHNSKHTHTPNKMIRGSKAAIAIECCMLTLLGFISTLPMFANATISCYILCIQIFGCLLNEIALHCNGNLMPVLNLGCSTTDRHKHLDSNTSMKILCDVIPIGQYYTLSIGDVLINLSIGLQVFVVPQFLFNLDNSNIKIIVSSLFGVYLAWIIIQLCVWLVFVIKCTAVGMMKSCYFFFVRVRSVVKSSTSANARAELNECC